MCPPSSRSMCQFGQSLIHATIECTIDILTSRNMKPELKKANRDARISFFIRVFFQFLSLFVHTENTGTRQFKYVIAASWKIPAKSLQHIFANHCNIFAERKLSYALTRSLPAFFELGYIWCFRSHYREECVSRPIDVVMNVGSRILPIHQSMHISTFRPKTSANEITSLREQMSAKLCAHAYTHARNLLQTLWIPW